MYKEFKPGDIVTVVPSEHSMWMNCLNHPKAQYVVKKLYPTGEYACCAGHPYQLEMTDGTFASAMWFDEYAASHHTWCKIHTVDELDRAFGLAGRIADGEIDDPRF